MVVYTYDRTYIWRGHILGGIYILKRYTYEELYLQGVIHTEGLMEKGYTYN